MGSEEGRLPQADARGLRVCPELAEGASLRFKLFPPFLARACSVLAEGKGVSGMVVLPGKDQHPASVLSHEWLSA
jgi:hypothetical protein